MLSAHVRRRCPSLALLALLVAAPGCLAEPGAVTRQSYAALVEPEVVTIRLQGPANAAQEVSQLPAGVRTEGHTRPLGVGVFVALLPVTLGIDAALLAPAVPVVPVLLLLLPFLLDGRGVWC